MMTEPKIAEGTRYTKTQHIKLFEDLETALRKLNKNSGFHMRFWARNKEPTSPQLDCGIQACAAGLGTTLPSWKKAGLRLVPPKFINGAQFGIVHDASGSGGYDALSNALSIRIDIVEYLFCPTRYKRVTDPVLVADRIKRVIDIWRKHHQE